MLLHTSSYKCASLALIHIPPTIGPSINDGTAFGLSSFWFFNPISFHPGKAIVIVLFETFLGGGLNLNLGPFSNLFLSKI